MSTDATKLSSVGTKFQVGAAACAIATAAALTPAVAANADIALPAPTAPAMTELANIAAAPVLNAVSYAEQGGWIWFGEPRPGAPAKSTFFEFKPLVLVPQFLRPLFGWFERINFEACIFGISVSIGPYGSIKASVSRGC